MNISLLSLQVALKVKCPTDERMAACLKMTDPAQLTLAGSLSLSSSPDSKSPTHTGAGFILVKRSIIIIITKEENRIFSLFCVKVHRENQWFFTSDIKKLWTSGDWHRTEGLFFFCIISHHPPVRPSGGESASLSGGWWWLPALRASQPVPQRCWHRLHHRSQRHGRTHLHSHGHSFNQLPAGGHTHVSVCPSIPI